EYAALLAAEGLLGHQHANSGWGTFDDDNMVGATAFMETLELALELRRAGDGGDGGGPPVDLLPATEGAGRGGRRGERAAPRLGPLSVHGGRGRGRAPERPAVALHRLGRGPDRRCGAAR